MTDVGLARPPAGPSVRIVALLLGLGPSRVAVPTIADHLLRRGTLNGAAAHAAVHGAFLDVASGRHPR